ncbi:hypothetical protein DIPPA_59033, partial [Diplonema papillatum]
MGPVDDFLRKLPADTFRTCTVVDSLEQYDDHRSRREFGSIPGVTLRLRNEQKGCECAYIALWRALAWRTTGKTDLPTKAVLLNFAEENFHEKKTSVGSLRSLDCFEVQQFCHTHGIGFVLSPDCMKTILYRRVTGDTTHREEYEAQRPVNIVFLNSVHGRCRPQRPAHGQLWPAHEGSEVVPEAFLLLVGSFV